MESDGLLGEIDGSFGSSKDSNERKPRPMHAAKKRRRGKSVRPTRKPMHLFFPGEIPAMNNDSIIEIPSIESPKETDGLVHLIRTETRIAGYLHKSLDTLRRQFIEEFQVILDDQDKYNAIIDAFIRNLSLDIRRNLVYRVETPISPPSFPMLNEFRISGRIDRQTYKTSSISALTLQLRGCASSINDSIEIRRQELSSAAKEKNREILELYRHRQEMRRKRKELAKEEQTLTIQKEFLDISQKLQTEALTNLQQKLEIRRRNRENLQELAQIQRRLRRTISSVKHANNRVFNITLKNILSEILTHERDIAESGRQIEQQASLLSGAFLDSQITRSYMTVPSTSSTVDDDDSATASVISAISASMSSIL